MEQNRREFVKTCACLGIAGAAMWLGAGCDTGAGGGGDPGPSGNTCDYTVDSQGRLVLDLSQCAHLSGDNSSIYLHDTPQGTVLVTRSTGDTYHALNARCTHQSCTVGATSPTLNCPCHGSRFNFSGGVVHGPASSPLHSYPLTKSGSVLTIDIT